MLPVVLPLRILIAEDNHINMKLAVKWLQKLGYQPDQAVDGEEAVAQVRAKLQPGSDGSPAQPYHVVFMDMQMPKLDGLQATGVIRTELKNLHAQPLVIIAMTANAGESDRKRCLVAGME